MTVFPYFLDISNICDEDIPSEALLLFSCTLDSFPYVAIWFIYISNQTGLFSRMSARQTHLLQELGHILIQRPITFLYVNGAHKLHERRCF